MQKVIIEFQNNERTEITMALTESDCYIRNFHLIDPGHRKKETLFCANSLKIFFIAFFRVVSVLSDVFCVHDIYFENSSMRIVRADPESFFLPSARLFNIYKVFSILCCLFDRDCFAKMPTAYVLCMQ